MTTLTSKFNKVLNGGYKLLAVLLVLFAVLLSGIRLLLPYADQYKAQVQEYINQQYQTNILLGSLSSGWENLGPTLVVKQVSIVRSELVNIYIDQIDISVDFWESLTSGQLVTSDFTLKGAKILIDKQALNQEKKLGNNANVLKLLGELFLKQITRFSLEDSQVRLVQLGQLDRTLLIENLAWFNQQTRHKAEGEIIFDGISSNNIKLLLDITGNELATTQGRIYLSANNIDISPWLDQLLPNKPESSKTAINFQSWITVENGWLTKAQIDLGENKIKWSIAEQSHQLAIAPTQLLIEAKNNMADLNLYSSPLMFTFDGQRWQPLNIQLSQSGNQLSGYASYLNVNDVAKLAPLLGVQLAQLQQLDELAMTGSIEDIYWQKQSDAAKVSMQLNHLSTQYSRGIPKMTDLNANVIWQQQQKQQQFQVMLRSENQTISFDGLFDKPLQYQQLTGVINGKITPDYWQINGQQFQFSSDVAQLTTDFSAQQYGEQPVTLALYSSVAKFDVAKIARYYPTKIMSENLVKYLVSGIKSGQLVDTRVLFNGPLSSFPFTDKHGIFSVIGQLQQAEFQFSPEWPAIKQFDAELNFTNNSMLISAKQGKLLDINVNGVSAEIADLSHQPLLKVDYHFNQLAPEAVHQLMNDSPLRKSVGQSLEQLQLLQPISGDFNLLLPLSTDEPAIASGDIILDNNQLKLSQPEMLLTAVTGRLHFENSQITTENLQFNWQQLPLVANVKTENKDDYFLTKINFSGDWQPSLYQKKLPEKLTPYVNGHLNWQGDLSLYFPHDGAFSYQLMINSDLEQMALALPQPYKKTVAEKLPLKVEVNGQLNQSTFNATLGEQLSFFGVLKHQTAQFERAHLLLGKEQMLLPMNGFHISANLAEVDIQQWQPFLSDLFAVINESQSENTPLFPKPKRMLGQIDQLILGSQQLEQVSFNLLDQTNWWLLQLNAKQTRSKIKIYPDWDEQGVEIAAEFIKLTTASTDTSSTSEVASQDMGAQLPVKTTLTPQQLLAQYQQAQQVFNMMPPLKLHCDSCQINQIDFGTVDAAIERQKDKIVLKQFTASRNKSTLTLKGEWRNNESQQRFETALSGQLKVKNVAQEIEKLGYESVIKDSGATFDFALNWNASPQHFNLAKLNGEIRAAFNDGYLADVSDKGARLFSVLSLQSLVRKLKLDFRDIFSDGLFYSQIKGDFQLINGVLYTNNTKMKGAAGDLFIKGNTDLVKGLLDYRMQYKPNLTSSLPVLAWIATLNPVTFLAGVAIDEVFTSKVVSEFDFELTGSVKDPVLKEVNRKNRDISVGRTTPPKFVDEQGDNNSTVVQPETNQNKMNKKNNQGKKEG